MSPSKRPSSRKSIGYLPSPDIDPAMGDKENIGGPLAHTGEPANSTIASRLKKSRSKSLGPGGLDALKEDAGNKRKAAAAVAPKSILKPTIPLSPLKEIPTRKPASATKPSSAASSPKQKSPAASPSKSPKSRASPSKAANASPSKAADVSPFKPTAEIPREPVTAPAEQEGDNNEDEAAAERQKQRDAIQKQRDLRRKSLANRRVSFAPEATLHTFDNLDDMQDSTTSSAATNSTRRRSSMSNFGASVGPQDPPSTPPEQADEDTVKASPAHQRDLHQKKRRRRSSGIPPMNFNDPNEALSSSPYSEASATVDAVGDEQGEGTPVESAGEHEASPSDLLMDLDDGTGEQQVPKSPTERFRPDQAAMLSPDAADNDQEDEGQTMKFAGNDVTAAFQPWMQQFTKPSQSASRFASTLDQENLNPFSPAFKAQQERSSGASSAELAPDNGDMSMDITRAIGGIVRSPAKRTMPSQQQQRTPQSARKDRRRSSGGSSAFDDGTMDFTTAVGGIQPSNALSHETDTPDENEDLSMEFTSVFGGIQNRRKSGNLGPVTKPQIEQAGSEDGADDADMEMTTALGTIYEQSEELTEQPMEAEETGQMDMTRPVGGIIQTPALRSDHVSPARSLGVRSATSKACLSTSISETGSPALSTPRGRGRPRKSEAAPTVSTPDKGAKTPSKQMTPQLTRPTTPGKTPPPNIAMRHPSPKKLFREEIKQARSSPVQQSSAKGKDDNVSGATTPTMKVAAKAHTKRRPSGIGFDKEGLGSPSVAALLDRRTSIGERADVFAPRDPESRGVRFQDPRALEAEVAKDHEEDERRESGQHILQNEADDADAGDRDATMTLKDAISSMTPKKAAAKSKGRKSLAVGSARGVLGKRPAELDDDEDRTPNGLKGREASPVKKVRLQGPPSASETTRRMFRQSLGAITGKDRPVTPITASPPKKSASTPSHHGYFKDVENLPSAQKPLPVLGQPGHVDEHEAAVDEEGEKISLQDFLNMTSIRFMELNTTKRRHTIAPGAGKGGDERDDWSQQDDAKRFEDSVVAGACTLPMLELYQHSCRELKKYISEGRNIVREIEASTLEENPPLFCEYVSATPADRSVMDNQFKNMKTHARHLSKGMWYEWRMKLLEGLREVLVSEADGLSNDGALLDAQERALEASLPQLMQQHEKLQSECGDLRARAEEIASCDQDELMQARQQLVSADQDIRSKKEKLAALKQQSQDLNSSIEDAQDAKVEHLQAIREAQRVREEYRGWSGAEVSKIKEQVEALESQHGWTIASASASRLTMAYDEQLELSFDAAAFLPGAASPDDTAKTENAPIRLSYTADQHEHKPKPLTTEKRFFLQLMRAHLHSIVQSQTTAQELLTFVSSTWTQCSALAEEVHRLDMEGITHCDILSDERLSVKTMMLIPNVATKVIVTFELGAAAQAMAVEVKLKARAAVAYGEQYREDKMRDFLKARIGEAMSGGKGTWADAVRELKKRLVQRGRK